MLAWAALLMLTGPVPAAGDEAAGVRTLTVVVRETAGIRRFGYPVKAVLSLAEQQKDVSHLRLLENGKPVVAQFMPLGDAKHGIRAVALDFNVSHAPYESREYVVEYGSVRPGPQPRGGVDVVTVNDLLRVRHGKELEFDVPKDLLGLLHQVRTPQTEYLRPGSAGLWIRYKDNICFRAGGFGPYGVATVAHVTKVGPLAGALRFESTEALRGGRSVASVVLLDFPLSKSWVQVTWIIDDPNGFVAGLGADLNLNIQGEPTLVDFGAGSLVYTPLRRGQAAVLRAGSLDGPNSSAPAWQTLTGPVGGLTPYVLAPRGMQLPPAEGWAHIMDRERCTAVAVQGFARPGQIAEITVEADGRLQLWRQFGRGNGAPSPAGPKRLTFWLHFVGMPVHVGAATSPQAMLAPLEVEVRSPRK
jgi:hypothetical protein